MIITIGAAMQKNEYQREYRARTNNAATKRYEKTKNGFLVRCYRNMLSRVQGVAKHKYHLYFGKDILSRDDFYLWALADPEFHRLFAEWEDAGYPRKMTPSVDRIDTTLGYTHGNMEWVTFSENCRRGGRWRPSQ